MVYRDKHARNPLSLPMGRKNWEDFLGWLVEPGLQSENKGKPPQLKILSKILKLFNELNEPGLKSHATIVDAIKLIEEHRERWNYNIYEWRSALKAGGSFCSKGGNIRAGQILYIALVVSAFLYPDEGAYEKVRKELARRGSQRELDAMKKSVSRALDAPFPGGRTKLAEWIYAEFKSSKAFYDAKERGLSGAWFHAAWREGMRISQQELDFLADLVKNWESKNTGQQAKINRPPNSEGAAPRT
jgi:hypothetical protein